MKLERLIPDVTDEIRFAGWMTPDGVVHYRELAENVHLAFVDDSIQPPRPDDVPETARFYHCVTGPKFTNGQHFLNVRPGQYGEMPGWERGSGPGKKLGNTQRRGTIHVCVPDPHDPTKEETRFNLLPGRYRENPDGTIDTIGEPRVTDKQKRKRLTYTIRGGELTKLSEEDLRGDL